MPGDLEIRGRYMWFALAATPRMVEKIRSGVADRVKRMNLCLPRITTLVSRYRVGLPLP